MQQTNAALTCTIKTKTNKDKQTNKQTEKRKHSCCMQAAAAAAAPAAAARAGAAAVCRQLQLIQETEQLQGLSNKQEYKNSEAKLQQISSRLKETNKELCKNLRQNPNLQVTSIECGVRTPQHTGETNKYM